MFKKRLNELHSFPYHTLGAPTSIKLETIDSAGIALPTHAGCGKGSEEAGAPQVVQPAQLRDQSVLIVNHAAALTSKRL